MRDWRTITNEKEKYTAYLGSREWAEKRESVRRRGGGICERCKKNPMYACNHLSYERRYNERLEDLRAVCQECHKFIHGKSNYDPRALSNYEEWVSIWREHLGDNFETLIEMFPWSLSDDSALRIGFSCWLANFDAWNAIQRFQSTVECIHPDDEVGEFCHLGNAAWESAPYHHEHLSMPARAWFNWFNRCCPGLRDSPSQRR